jgi:predicted NAD/FAD-dependent oxidoreductase
MRIAIVGAGIAGLACARRLTAGGADVRIFDKARGPGGRLATRRGDGWQADIGAQYFTARHPGFQDSVAVWAASGVVARWPAEPVRLERGSITARDDGRERWVGVPRMSALSRHLVQGLDIAPGRSIVALEQGPGWSLREAEGPTHGPFDAVVIALPAPQTAALLRPVAAALADEAAAVPMRGCWTAVLTVDSGSPPFEAAFVIDHPLRWIAHDGSKPGRDGDATWIAHASPDWSDPRLDWTPERVLPALVSLFADATGLADEAVRGLAAHKWRYSQSPAPHAAGFLLDSERAIGTCGDWCNGNRVEGAWVSGDEIAKRLLQHHGRPETDA